MAQFCSHAQAEPSLMVSSSGGCHCICGPPVPSGTYADCCLGSWRSSHNLLLKTASDFPLHLEQTPNTRIWFTRSCRIRILSNSPTPFGVTSLLAPATLAFLRIHPNHLPSQALRICHSFLSLIPQLVCHSFRKHFQGLPIRSVSPIILSLYPQQISISNLLFCNRILACIFTYLLCLFYQTENSVKAAILSVVFLSHSPAFGT